MYSSGVRQCVAHTYAESATSMKSGFSPIIAYDDIFRISMIVVSYYMHWLLSCDVN